MSATTAPRPHLPDPTAWSFPAFDRTAAGDLTIYTRDLPSRGMVAIDLLLDAPIVVEALEHAGIANLTGWALDEGTATRDGDAFAAALDRLGASLGTGVGTGGMRLSLDVPARHTAAALDLLAEAVATPTFPSREVDRLANQRLDQIRQQLARPDGRAAIVGRQETIAAEHRCSLPSAGSADTVGRLDRDLVAAFHAEQVLTGPATLIAAGDLTDVDLRNLAADRLAVWTQAGREPHAPVPLSYRPGRRIVVVDKPDAVQTQLLIQRPGPDRRAEDWASTRVAAHVLGGTLTSRLDIVLREELGYTYGIRTRLDPYRRGGVTQIASGSVHTDATGDAMQRLLDIVTRFADEGPTAEERDAAVEYLVGVRPLTLETPRALVSEVSRNLRADLTADHTDTELARMRDVTVEQVAVSAAEHLRADDLVIVAVGAADTIAPDLDGLGYAEVEVRSAA